MAIRNPAALLPTPGRARLWLLLAQAFSALVSALGFLSVFGRHAWVKAHLPGFEAHFGLEVLGLTLATLALARGWQAVEERRLRRLAALSEAALGSRTWRRALVAVLVMQYGVVGTFLTAVSHGVPPELVFTGILFLLVAPALTSSWIAGQAQRLLAQQRDLALQARMAPHFLYNCLSTLKGQIQEAPDEAMHTADRLAGLFRDLMAHTAEPLVSLGRELAWVEAYLGLEQARLGDRLRVKVEVPEELESTPVPPLCLQVLVENAVKHGIAPRKEGGLLTLRAERIGNHVCLAVSDPGDGTSDQRGTGQALAILRQRLAHPWNLRLEAIPGGGCLASVRVRA